MTAEIEWQRKLAGGFVLVVLGLACAGWWVGVPLLTLWGLGQATDDSAIHFVSGVVGVPLMMAATAPILFWLNGLYLRVSGALSRAEADARESGWRRQLRGPLEPIMLVSLIAAFAALCIWFFFVADNPSPSFW